MPAQELTEVATGMPWDMLADAREQLDDAVRFGEADDIAEARGLVEHWNEHCGNLGAFLMLRAFATCPQPLRELLSREFGQLSLGAWEEANAAKRALKAVLSRLDAVTTRMGELERRLDDITPGVGEPGRVRLVG